MALSYTLRCVECGKVFDDIDKGFLLDCDEKHCSAMLQADYSVDGFERSHLSRNLQIPKLAPSERHSALARAIVFKTKLSRKARTENLYFAFNGY